MTTSKEAAAQSFNDFPDKETIDSIQKDYLTQENFGRSLESLRTIISALRHPEWGCPWDRKQTMATIIPYTVEEVYEVVDAVKRDHNEDICQELGDLLLQVVLLSQIASEQGRFNLDDVIQSVSEKMVRRHPHVFAKQTTSSVRDTWNDIKRAERAKASENKPRGIFDDIAPALPALIRAEKTQNRSARYGFDWPDGSGVINKIYEELQELSEAIEEKSPVGVQDEFGDLMFTMINLARKLGLSTEMALDDAERKFRRRFDAMAAISEAKGHPLTEGNHDNLEELWIQVKDQEINKIKK